MWKERLWQVFLVAILGLTLTMCSRSSSNNSTSADGTTTVNVGPSTISHTMICFNVSDTGIAAGWTYYHCDASDKTTLSTKYLVGNTYWKAITHDAALAAGWKLVGSGCSTGNTGSTGKMCALFHK